MQKMYAIPRKAAKIFKITLLCFASAAMYSASGQAPALQYVVPAHIQALLQDKEAQIRGQRATIAQLQVQMRQYERMLAEKQREVDQLHNNNADTLLAREVRELRRLVETNNKLIFEIEGERVMWQRKFEDLAKTRRTANASILPNSAATAAAARALPGAETAAGVRLAAQATARVQRVPHPIQRGGGPRPVAHAATAAAAQAAPPAYQEDLSHLW